MKSIALSSNKKINFAAIVSIVVAWRLFLFLPFFVTLGVLTTQQHYLGGGLQNYVHLPYLWGWANFDGEHYLSIARYGYQPLSYFFFPLYPLLIRLTALPLGDGLIHFLFSGLIVSHLSLIFALLGLWKLLSLDYKTRTSLLIILIIILFPTAFYFAGVYTESLFLALVVWSFYFARKGKWYLVGVLGFLACTTRLIGIVLFPAMLFEWWSQNRLLLNANNIRKLLWIFVIPFGLLLYMMFLYRETGDPLEFFNNVSIFGDQRSSRFILIPQVFYRYIFKILPVLTYTYWPSIFTPLLEFVTASLFGILCVFSFKRLRGSYSLYLIGGYLMPTLSGSFSSLPRYVLVLFPGFILLGLMLIRLPKIIQMLLLLTLAGTLTVSQAMFVHGYWLS